MPSQSCDCPAQPSRIGPFLRKTLLFLMICAGAGVFTSRTAIAQTQTWDVRAFGIKVGELNLNVRETPHSYAGSGRFQTTGLAGVLRRIRFSVSAQGQLQSSELRPRTYKGSINTGRRISETTLAFEGDLPRKVAGAQAPKQPIAQADLRGALDPMSMMWTTLRDQTDATLCQIEQTQFDGTRLVRITLKDRTSTSDQVTCAGTYDRIGGYSSEELAEMTTSPVSITYRREGTVWRAVGLAMTTRHGKATMLRVQ